MAIEDIQINDSTNDADILALAKTPLITIDVTGLSSLNRLPEDGVNAQIYTSATTFHASFSSATRIFAPNATDVDIGALVTVTDLYFPASQFLVKAEKLESARSVVIGPNAVLDAPLLEIAERRMVATTPRPGAILWQRLES